MPTSDFIDIDLHLNGEIARSQAEGDRDIVSELQTVDFATWLKGQKTRHQKMVEDFRRPYFPGQDNIYRSNRGLSHQGETFGFNLYHLDSWMHYSVGVGYMASYGISKETTKNGFCFIDDPDKEDADDIKKPRITKWMRKTNFLHHLWLWQAFNEGFGIGIMLGYWGKRDIEGNTMSEEAPKTPPIAFEVMNPWYFSPTGDTLNTSNRLNYSQELWSFTGGGINVKTNVHKSRVFILRTREVPHRWWGLPTFDPPRYSLLGYFNDLIYYSRGIQNWGDSVPTLYYGNSFFTPIEQRKVMEVLDAYEMNGRIHLPENARLEFHPTQIGRGIAEVHEQYKEDLSSAWRIPKNQLFGRSEGGGLTQGPAKISKDDFYERIGADQNDITQPIMKNFFWRFFPNTENLWLRWVLNVYKTDEQRLRERGLHLDNMRKELEIEKTKFELNAAKSGIMEMLNNRGSQGMPVPGKEVAHSKGGNGKVREVEVKDKE